MIYQNVRMSLNTFFMAMVAHFKLNCVPDDDFMDSVTLINSLINVLSSG